MIPGSFSFRVLRLPACLPVSFCLLLCAVPASGHDGDINLDGTVGLADLLWGVQALQGSRTLLPESACNADVAPLVSGVPAPDGAFNAGDLTVLWRMLLEGLRFGIPGNQFNIGDSIGVGESAYNSTGELTPTPNHDVVWSTGFNGSDVVNSINERFEMDSPATYYENDINRDAIFNHAVRGSVMADFAAQAQGVIAAAALTPSGEAGMVTVFLGSNDVCAPSLAEMTDPVLFEDQFKAGLDVLAGSDLTRTAQVHVSGLPAIYWLWNAKRSTFWCYAIVWPFVPCENLLAGDRNDCESSTSREDPDMIYPGDGNNCVRRKLFHAAIRDTYNPILRRVLEEYRETGKLPNARYTDIFDVRFDSVHVNNGDCFHPSATGHALLAQAEWTRTHWGHVDPVCGN